ncbi:MAG: hypothetical protein WBN78_10875 [Gammaproteobacteria bacterium]
MKTLTMLFATLLAMAMAMTSLPALAGGAPAGDKSSAARADRHTSKPSAPVDLVWLQDGREGTVEIEIIVGTAHDGVDLLLFTDGSNAPLTQSLPAAGAGPAGAVTWTLEQPLQSAPRVMAVLRQGEARQARNFVAPWRAGQDVVDPNDSKSEQPRSSESRNGKNAGNGRNTAPVDAAVTPESETPLHAMPATETLRRDTPSQEAGKD